MSTLDLSQYQMEPKSNLFADAGEVGKREVGADMDIAGAQEGLSSFENDRRGSEG